MATAAKKTTKVSATPAAKTRPAKPPKASKSAASALPFLRFHHSQALRSKTLAVLDELESAPDPTVHRDALTALVAELNKAGMDYCFIRSLKAAKPGFIVEQSASLGMAGALQLIGSVVRSIIGRMNGPQLLSVSGSIRELMR